MNEANDSWFCAFRSGLAQYQAHMSHYLGSPIVSEHNSPAAGDQMILRETMKIIQTGEYSRAVTVEMKFTDGRAQLRIVYENGGL